MLPLVLCGLLQVAAPASAPTVAMSLAPAGSIPSRPILTMPGDSAQPRPRPHAVVLSDWYYRRLLIHRWGSYLELPLFAAQYALGNRLLSDPSTSLKHEHLAVAGTIGALFVVNTTTGMWNLLDAWPPPEKRSLVLTHMALMLSSEAGFAITGVLGRRTDRLFTQANKNTHRAAALTSIGLAATGTTIMWLWNRH
jgi:hypothetical protein